MSPAGYRLVLVGASGGLGRAFAMALAPASAAMVLCGRDGARLQALAQKIGTMHPGITLHVVAGDLLDPQTAAATADAARRLGGPLDLLVNAAGISDFTEFEQQDPGAMERLIAVNLLAPVRITQRLLPLLKAAPKAQIVNIGSIFGYLGYPGFAVYCATKFGLRGFSQALRRELADTSVAVRYFAPRAVRTPINPPAVGGMNRELRTAEDEPEAVAAEFVRFLAQKSWDRRLGFPERLYVWLNRIVPAVNDSAIRGQLPVIRRHLRGEPAPATDKQRRLP